MERGVYIDRCSQGWEGKNIKKLIWKLNLCEKFLKGHASKVVRFDIIS